MINKNLLFQHTFFASVEYSHLDDIEMQMIALDDLGVSALLCIVGTDYQCEIALEYQECYRQFDYHKNNSTFENFYLDSVK